MSMQSAQLQHPGLLNPHLWDLLLTRILPGLPSARLASLRASCSCLQERLDGPSAACLWATATQCQLYNAQDYHSCSVCIQRQLHWRGEALRQLASGGKITQWPATATDALLQGWSQPQAQAKAQQIVIAKWSPCSRWFIIVKRASKSCKNGIDYNAAELVVQVFDTVHRGFQQIGSYGLSPYSPLLDRVAWHLTDVQCFPARIGPSQWIVLIGSSSRVFGSVIECLTCHDLTTKQEHQLHGRKGQTFELAFGKADPDHNCVYKAAAWAASTRRVDIYQLPSLTLTLVLTQRGAQGSKCTAVAIMFSPDATKLAIWWQATATQTSCRPDMMQPLGKVEIKCSKQLRQ